MAKKAELIEEARKLKLKVSNQNTIAEIEAAIKASGAEIPAQEPEADIHTTTKAGRHSSKALREEAEMEAKAERKSKTNEESTSKPKKVPKPTRSRLDRRGKNYRTSFELVDKSKNYDLNAAIELIKQISKTKFDATVELHVNLSLDPRHADQNLRDSLVLPAGTGRTLKIAVFGEGDDAANALKAGADIAGITEITDMLDKGQTNFDVLISTPAQMAKLGKYARILGPRGLMPNPKSNTVSTDITKAVSEAKAGRVEYRVDSTGIVHLGVGKVSFAAKDLMSNLQVVIGSIKSNKPQSVKGVYMKSAHLTTTMGPSIKLDLSSL